MGTVIHLPKREAVPRHAQASAPCEIVIFPGVRIERPQPEPRAPQQASHRRRRNRKSGQSA